MPHCSNSSVYTTLGYNQEQSCWVRGPISTALGPRLQLAEFADLSMPPCACGPISHSMLGNVQLSHFASPLHTEFYLVTVVICIS